MKVLKILQSWTQTTFDTHGFVFGKDSRFWVEEEEEEDKERIREIREENISISFYTLGSSFYTLGSYSFPSKKRSFKK